MIRVLALVVAMGATFAVHQISKQAAVESATRDLVHRSELVTLEAERDALNRKIIAETEAARQFKEKFRHSQAALDALEEKVADYAAQNPVHPDCVVGDDILDLLR